MTLQPKLTPLFTLMPQSCMHATVSGLLMPILVTAVSGLGYAIYMVAVPLLLHFSGGYWDVILSKAVWKRSWVRHNPI